MKRLLCIALIWSAPAFAQVSGEVKRYLHSAAALFEKLEYEKALAQIKRAKSKSQGQEDDTQISLYEGIVLAEMGDAQASTAFTSALGLEPDSKLPLVVSPKVQHVFDKAKASVAKLLEAQDAAEAARAEEQRKQEEASKPPPAEVKPEPVVVAKPPPPPPPSNGGKYAGIGVGVAGIAIAATGGLMLGLANSAGGQLTSGAPTTYALAQSLASTGKLEQTLGFVGLGVGAAALAAGIVLFAVGGSSSGATASAIVTPNGGMVSVRIPLP